MATQMELGGVVVDVVKKDIKNIHLSVYPPTGRVRISAPRAMTSATIRGFVISKLGWIRQQQKKLEGQSRESQREYIDRESHYVWGKRYLLEVVEVSAGPHVQVHHSKLRLQIRPGATLDVRAAVMAAWYRELLRIALSPLISKWEQKLGVQATGCFVQSMKTRWGSCNSSMRTIRINTELAKKPRECLEYIVVHELVHFLQPNHGAKFIALMDQHLPHWRETRDLLNRLPAKNEWWLY